MRLADWRKQEGYTQQQLADELGVNQSSISFWERADDPQLPSPEYIRRIFAATRGAVTPNDFYNLPAIDQACLQLAAADAPLLAAAAGDDH